MVKILAFSDLHSNVDATRAIVHESTDADLLIGAVDLGNFGQGVDDVIATLRQAICPTVLIAGNHDNLEHLRTACTGWQDCHVLHAETVSLAGLTIFGLGAEIPRRNPADWNFALTEHAAAPLLARCPDGALLVTHMPPFGHADQQRDGRHDGSHAVAESIAARQPALSLCGHVHSAWGTSGQIGKTPIHNLGPKPNWYEL